MAQDNTTTPPSGAPAAPAPTPPPGIAAPEPSAGPLYSQPAPPPAPSAPVAVATPAPAPETPEELGVRQYLKSLGLSQFDRYENDAQALQELALRARDAERLREYAQLGQQVLPDLESFRKWKAEQEAQRQQQQAQAKKWWTPPEYDPRWKNLVQVDPQTGQLVAAPGAPFGVVDKYRAATEHLQTVLEKLAFNDPVELLKPGLEQFFQEKMEPLLQERLAAVQERLEAEKLLQQNAAWMYQAGPDGRPTVSPYGQVYMQTVAALDQRGIRDVGLQNEWARDKAQLVMLSEAVRTLQAQLQHPAPAATGTPVPVNPPPAPPANPAAAQAEANASFERRRGGRRASQATPATLSGTPEQPISSLREALMAALKEQGVDPGAKLVAA